MKLHGFRLPDLSPPDEENGTAVTEHMQKPLDSMGKLFAVRTIGCRPILVGDDGEIMDGYNVVTRIQNIMGALVSPAFLKHCDAIFQKSRSSVNLPELSELHKTFEAIF